MLFCPVCAVLSLVSPFPPPPGIPSEGELLASYCAAAGRPAPSPQAWCFYLALSLFRLLAILAGVQVGVLVFGGWWFGGVVGLEVCWCV